MPTQYCPVPVRHAGSGSHLDEADLHLTSALASLSHALGRRHPDVLRLMSSQASLYEAQGRLEDAARAHKATLAGRVAALGEAHPDTQSSRQKLSLVRARLSI